jgi:hypothetical protein
MSRQIYTVLRIFRCRAILSVAMGKKVKVVRLVDVDDLAEMGRLGGKATAATRTPEERKSAAKRAVEARWDRYYAEHPEKRKTARTAASRNKTKK